MQMPPRTRWPTPGHVGRRVTGPTLVHAASNSVGRTRRAGADAPELGGRHPASRRRSALGRLVYCEGSMLPSEAVRPGRVDRWVAIALSVTFLAVMVSPFLATPTPPDRPLLGRAPRARHGRREFVAGRGPSDAGAVAVFHTDRPSRDHRPGPVHRGSRRDPSLAPWRFGRGAAPPGSRWAPRTRHRHRVVRRAPSSPAWVHCSV